MFLQSVSQLLSHSTVHTNTLGDNRKPQIPLQQINCDVSNAQR